MNYFISTPTKEIFKSVKDRLKELKYNIDILQNPTRYGATMCIGIDTITTEANYAIQSYYTDLLFAELSIYNLFNSNIIPKIEIDVEIDGIKTKRQISREFAKKLGIIE